MPLMGWPMLSTRALSSSAGMIRRIASSTCAMVRLVVSRRVPTGVRTCIRICPESTAGKKFRPRDGTSAKDTKMKPNTVTSTILRCSSATCNRP
ncbi:hypothetical protein D3C85_1227830 [compost metagenome]